MYFKKRINKFECVCLCVCACARVRVRVCVCVCFEGGWSHYFFKCPNKNITKKKTKSL